MFVSKQVPWRAREWLQTQRSDQLASACRQWAQDSARQSSMLLEAPSVHSTSQQEGEWDGADPSWISTGSVAE